MNTLHYSSNYRWKADDMEPEAAKALPAQRYARAVNIVPEADVTLKVGTSTDSLNIRASGLILGLVSKVFRAMLNSQFVEGTTKVIDLKDEPQTVLDFCRVIHYKHDCISNMEANRLRNLIVFADMWQCHEALKPWLLYTLQPYLIWFDSLAATDLDGTAFPDQYPGLRIEDFIPIAASFGLDDLFWQVTVAYFARSKTAAGSCDEGCLVGRLPLATSHDGVCLYDLLDETRIAHTRRLLTRVSQAMAFGYGAGGNDYFDLGDVEEGDHGSFQSWLFIEGLDVNGLPSYSESWWTASIYVRDLATPDPPSPNEVDGPDGATWEGDCVTPGCKCCLPKDLRALRVILDEELMDLPGKPLNTYQPRTLALRISQSGFFRALGIRYSVRSDILTAQTDDIEMSSSKLYLAVIGVGGVGTSFLSQLSSLPARLRPNVIFVSRSSKQLYNSSYTPVNASDLQSSSSKLLSIPDELIAYLSSAPGKVILVDNTSSQDVANAYPSFLRNGISVVTPNKKAFSGSLQLWNDIFSAVDSSQGNALVYHESSVGAGLPVISTLKDLVATGDQVTRIEGVFSGTMSFLFNSFAPADGSGKGKWSEIVKQAKEAGYTEPDPRDDLNGMDVARKLTILARLAGLKVEGPDSFPVQSLIPKELETAKSSDEFMTRLPEFDAEMESYKDNAAKEGKVVRYVGSVDVGAGKVKVGLEMVEKGTPIASLRGSDNLICFYTKRYGSNPLVIQGAGAGGEVTAMGVTADLIKVVERLT